jgi:hypothetical protein
LKGLWNPASLQDAWFWVVRDQPLRSWLISGVASRLGEGRRREWFWQKRRAMGAMEAMDFLATYFRNAKR